MSIIVQYKYVCVCTFSFIASHKIFKGVHKIGKLRLHVQTASSPPTSEQRQNAVYSIGPQSTPPSTRQQTTMASSHTIKDQQKITTPTCIQQQIRDPISTDQKIPPPVTTNQESPPPVTFCDQQTPPHIGTIQQQPVKDHYPSYIMVSGLTDSISTEDIVAHFQTARCGGGTVTEVTHMEQSKDRALVGISGIELNRKFVICGSAFNLNLYVQGVLHISSLAEELCTDKQKDAPYVAIRRK